ncbi:hypothetical protein V6N13_055055 [Hibiscus sabdariffa]
MNAVAGDRTRVTRVTGGNTHHYTTTTLMSDALVSRLWFDDQFGFAFAPAVGKSGGVVVIWNSVNFVMEDLHVASRFIAIVGSWVLEEWRCGVVEAILILFLLVQNDGVVVRRCKGNSCSRLDRFLVSDAWLSQFSDLKIISLPRGLSDYTPILLCNAYMESGPKS